MLALSFHALKVPLRSQCMIDDVYGLQKVGSFFIIIRISKIIVRRKVSHNNSRTQFVSLPYIKKEELYF